jgi:hypothetical protein
VHWLVAIDFTAQQMIVYANDTPLPTSAGSVWLRADPVDTTVGPWQLRQDTVGGAADLWIAPTFLDLSDVTIRRQFINPDLSAVPLPSNGHITVGGSTVVPAVFLHALSNGSPGDFLTNSGSGPSWVSNRGGLAFQPEPGSCVISETVVPPPAVPTNLRCGSATAASIRPTWDAVLGAASYTLRYRASGATTWIVISGITTTSQTITGLASSTSYEWQVATSVSAWSGSFSCSTLAPASAPILALLRQPLLHFIGERN